MLKRKSAVSIDWIFLSVFLSIVLIGWLMLYASSYQGPGFWFDFDSSIGSQSIWLGLASITFLAVLAIDWRIWNSLSYPIYIICILLLIAVLIFGREIKGASSWFSFMGLSIQPSEFAKIGTALALSAFLSKPNISLEINKNIFIGIALFAVPSLLVFIQPDAGTAMIFLAFVIPLFRAGLNASLYIVALSMAGIFIGSLLWNPKVMILIIFIASYFFLGFNIKNKKVSFGIVILLSLFSCCYWY